MKAPRYAHWRLLVPMLAMGMAIGPVRAHAAPAKPTGKAEPAPPKQGEAGEAPEGEGDEAPAGEGDAGSKGKAGEAPKKDETGKPPKAGGTSKKGKAGEPDGETGDAPAEDASEAPTDDAEPSSEAAATPEAEADTAAAPEAGTPEDEPAEPASTEPEQEPQITVQPRPVEPSLETSTLPSGVASRESVADPRRLRSDDRTLFRAGILSLSVAAAAAVPTVIGFQQAYAAHLDDEPARERTMRGLGIGAGVAAGTYAITGVVLLALGARQRRAVVAPAVGPGQLGAVLRARF